MSHYSVSVFRDIDAPIEVLYNLVSDYQVGHPAILPPNYFKKLTVESGGNGAGTVARAEMDVMGSKRSFVLRVSEPVPGRVLVEEDSVSGTVTRFVFDPLDDGRTRVTIATEARTTAGLRGFLERLMNPSITRRIYHEELALLEKVAFRGAESAR